MPFLFLILLAVDPSVAAIVAPAGGRVGFAALDLASERSLGLHENEVFPTQSVFKLPVAIEVLHQVDVGRLDLARVIDLGPSQTENGRTNATNDVGLITLPNGNRVAIVVFVNASPADETTRERTIAQLARLAYDTFGLPPGKTGTAPGVPVEPQQAAAFELHELDWPPFQTVRVWAPAAAPEGPQRKYETLLLLHGNRPPGSDKTHLIGLREQPQFRERILIVPGRPDGDHGWDRPEVTRALAALVEKMTGTYAVDPKRLYLLGHSAGGSRVLPVARALSTPVAGIISLAGDIGRPLRSHPPTLAAFARTPILLICNSEDVGPNASCALDGRNRDLLARLGVRDVRMQRLESSHAVSFDKLAPVLDEWLHAPTGALGDGPGRSTPPSRGIREP